MTGRFSWAGIAVSLTAFAVWGVHGAAFAQEEGGTKTAHELRAEYERVSKARPWPSSPSPLACH